MPDSAVGDLLGLASPDAPAPVATEESVKPERSATVRYLYHEPQLSSLCGVHALNNLLQGPYFGAGDLGEIAARVETREREILHDAALAERSASSGHVDANFGDFSIEVLSAALEGHGLRLLNIASSEVVVQIASSPEHEEGYLCHRGSHWFALRSIVGLWFNVDSRLERPRLLSDQAATRPRGRATHAAHSPAGGSLHRCSPRSAAVSAPLPLRNRSSATASGASATAATRSLRCGRRRRAATAARRSHLAAPRPGLEVQACIGS